MVSQDLPTVCVVDSRRFSYVTELEVESQAAEGRANLELVKVDSEEELVSALRRCDVMINWHRVPLPATVMPILAQINCRGIVRAAVGYDNIDLYAARCHRIPVANVPDYGIDEVADHTVGLLLSLARGFQGAREVIEGHGWNWNYDYPRHRLSNRSIGIIGLGRIGLAVAKRVTAFGLSVSFYDPYLASGIEKAFGFRRFESLDELLRSVDIVSIHTPLTDETRGMIGARELALLPRGAILLNTSRGDVLSLDALRKHIEVDPSFRVGLDVLEGEPSVPTWVVSQRRILVTPHCAFFSSEAMVDLRRRSVEIAIQFLEGIRPREVVN